MNQFHLWLTKEEIEPETITGATVVIIDVFLATTTLVTIMERGARRVIPVGSVEEALELKQKLGADSCLTGGEEGGLRVSEFDCGHLLDDFPPEKVKNKDIVFLSTNGTRAISRSKNAGKVLIANLRNATAVADYLNTLKDEDVYIVCSGSLGHFSIEDFMCASIIIQRLNLEGVQRNDAVRLALEQQLEEKNHVMDILKRSRIGQRLIEGDLHDLLQYAGDLGASDSLVYVKGGELAFMQVARRL